MERRHFWKVAQSWVRLTEAWLAALGGEQVHVPLPRLAVQQPGQGRARPGAPGARTCLLHVYFMSITTCQPHVNMSTTCLPHVYMSTTCLLYVYYMSTTYLIYVRDCACLLPLKHCHGEDIALARCCTSLPELMSRWRAPCNWLVADMVRSARVVTGGLTRVLLRRSRWRWHMRTSLTTTSSSRPGTPPPPPCLPRVPYYPGAKRFL